MEQEKLSPEKSFELITQVITQARNKFEENGFAYMFWGALTAIAAIAQFILLKNEYYDINWYPYLLMPAGGIFTFIYFYKKKKKHSQNQISRIVSVIWIVLSLNMMILGFLYAPILHNSLIPVILVLLSLGTMVSGVSIKSTLIIFSGIITNIAAFICFNLELLYHPLLLGIVSIMAIFIPGVWLMIQNQRIKNV